MPAGNAGTQLPGSLRMGNVRVAAAFSGNSLIYRMDDVNYVSDPNQAFIADPASMLGNEMATWLDRSRAFKSVTQPGSTQSARYVLEATVIELHGDFRPGKPPAAVVKVQFVLLDYSGTLPSVVYEGTIGRREPLERASPDILVRGYGTALSEILFAVRLRTRRAQDPLNAHHYDASRPPSTCRQGQFLAFIYTYTLVNGRPPAEADMMRFFRLTPPSAHQMVLTLAFHNLTLTGPLL